MRSLRLALAGLRYRGARSALLVVLAALSCAAAVLGPAYARAAEQSVLLDQLRAAPNWLTGISVESSGVAGDQGRASVVGGTSTATMDALARVPVADLTRTAARDMRPGDFYAPPVAGVQTSVTMPSEPGVEITGRLVYRQGYCDRLRLVSGHCPRAAGEVVASTRGPYRVGATVRVGGSVPSGSPGSTTVRVVGSYRPPGSDTGYWFNRGYFGYGASLKGDTEVRRQDAFFGSETTVRTLGASAYTVLADFTLRTGQVRLDDLATVRARLATGTHRLSAAGLSTSTPLLGVLSDVDYERSEVSVTALLVAVQLVLLCWFVLFGVVRGAIDERGAELGLAKLRGLPGRRVAGFGLTEIGLLIGLAAPVGLALGLGATELVAWFGLADGVNVELRPPVLLAALAGLAGALLAAVVAVRRTLVTPVIELLRRVPVRAGRLRTTLTEAVLVVVALAACFQLVTGAAGRLGLLAGGLLALAVGVIVGRLVPLVLRRRVSRAARRGALTGLLAAARLSRRGMVGRTVALVTVAVALLCYGVIVWDVAGRNQQIRAGAALGATAVYSVRAPSVSALRDAVDRADPAGHDAMAVARGLSGAGAKTSEIIGVDTSRLADVAYWQPSFAGTDIATLAADLRPPAAPVATLHGPHLTADVDVASVSPDVLLVALLVTPQRTVQVARLGQLTPGRHRMTGTLSGCRSGCRLQGFDLYRGPTTPTTIRGAFTVRGLSDAGGAAPADLRTAGAWRGVTQRFGETVSTVSAGHSGVAVRFDSAGGEDLRALYSDAPYPLPAATTGRIGTGTTFTGSGLYGLDQSYRVVTHARSLPSIHDGVMVDLADADREAPFGSSLDTPLRYEVWAGPNAPAGLRAALVAAGLRITGTDTIGAHETRLARGGAALALRLYLLAAVVALLLAIGSVLVTAYLTARPVLGELAGLRLVGMPGRLLRRAGWREYGTSLGTALVAGTIAGGVGAALALPHLPLGAAGGPPPDFWPDPWWPGGALVASALLLAAVAVLIVGVTVRHGTPQRLREGQP